jgi:hypothetical protein
MDISKRLLGTRFTNAIFALNRVPRKLTHLKKYVLVGRLLGTFTDAISCFETGPQEPYRDIYF